MKRKRIKRYSLAWAALLIGLLTLNTGAYAAADNGTHMDAVLAVDVSTSMNESDVSKVSFEAMKMFVDMASVQGDKIGLIAYTDQILREKALLKLQGAQDKQELKSYIDQLTRGPYTDVAVGVNEAVKVLQSGAEAGHAPLIVLLTDGNNSLNTGKSQAASDQMLNDALTKAKAGGIPVYTIGLNADGKLNKDTLERISKETGGKSFVTSTADTLPQILSEIYASHLKLKVVPLQGLTGSGQFQEVAVPIPNTSVLEANVSIMSAQPVEVKLADPSGKEIPVPSDRVVYSTSNAYSLVKILTPAQGDWKLRVKGVPKEKININLIYNYDVQVSVAPLSSISYKPGAAVPVQGHLESNGQKLADADLYKQGKAALVVTDLDTKQTAEAPLQVSASGIAGEWKIPEAHDYELKVRFDGSGFSRESAALKLSAKAQGTGGPATDSPGAAGLGGTTIGIIAAGLVALLAALFFVWRYWSQANKGFVGQLVVEVKDEDTGERSTPQYRKLAAFKGKVQLHQLLQLAPEFAETKDVVLRPGPGDTLLLHNASPAAIEKNGRVVDASARPGQPLKNGERLTLTLQNVHKSITVEYVR